MNKFKYTYILLFLAVGFSSCEDFLSEAPSKSTSVEPTTIDQFESLLNNYTTYCSESNSTAMFSSDDYGMIPDLYDDSPSLYNQMPLHHAILDVDYLPVTDSRSYWSTEWPKIFNANMILLYIDNVEGTEDEKNDLKAEAHFIRAYSYFQLVRTFCLPYHADNLDELGLPIKVSTSFEESLKRATLGETWNMIVSDLEKALTLNRELELNDGKYRTWRASTPAINAFAARVYLEMKEYNKAQQYAADALADHSEMMDYNTDMRFSSIPSEEQVGEDLVTLHYPYTHDAQSDQTDRMEWKELYYYRFLNNGHWYYIPSVELLSTYDQEYDLRYKYHIVEDYSYSRGATYSYPGYIFFFKGEIPSGPTVAEMLLVEAECKARQGEWESAITTVNKLRAVRMDNSAPADRINLAATSQEDALAKILEERRRELPYTQRFFDIRRYNNNDNANDDVVIERNFYPVAENVVEISQGVQKLTIEKKSRKFARPLPSTDILSSLGELEQNVY